MQAQRLEAAKRGSFFMQRARRVSLLWVLWFSSAFADESGSFTLALELKIALQSLGLERLEEPSPATPPNSPATQKYQQLSLKTSLTPKIPTI